MTDPDHPEPDSEVQRVQMRFVQEIPALRGMLWALVPDRHRLNDVVQETFLTVTQKAHDFQPGTNFRAWLFAIARFKVLHSLREARLEQSLSPELIELLIPEAPDIEIFDERLIRLRACITRLSHQRKRMLHLRYEEGLSIADVADRMGRRVNSIKVMLSQLRGALRDCIENQKHLPPNPR